MYQIIKFNTHSCRKPTYAAFFQTLKASCPALSSFKLMALHRSRSCFKMSQGLRAHSLHGESTTSSPIRRNIVKVVFLLGRLCPSRPSPLIQIPSSYLHFRDQVKRNSLMVKPYGRPLRPTQSPRICLGLIPALPSSKLALFFSQTSRFLRTFPSLPPSLFATKQPSIPSPRPNPKQTPRVSAENGEYLPWRQLMCLGVVVVLKRKVSVCKVKS